MDFHVQHGDEPNQVRWRAQAHPLINKAFMGRLGDKIHIPLPEDPLNEFCHRRNSFRSPTEFSAYLIGHAVNES